LAYPFLAEGNEVIPENSIIAMASLMLRNKKKKDEINNARQVAMKIINTYPDISFPDFAGEPLNAVLWGILAQRQNFHEANKVFYEIKKNYPDFKSLAQVDPTDLANALKSNGLDFYKSKSQQILACLESVFKKYSKYSLASSDDLERDVSILPGCGPRTTGIIKLFFLDISILPVESPVKRISVRIGWIDEMETPSIEKQLACLSEILSLEEMRRLYLGMVEHGQKICLASKPRCKACVIQGFCRVKKI